MAPVLPRLGLSLTSILVLFAVKAERKKHNKTVYLKIKGNVVLDFLLVVVQSLSHVWLLATPCTAARQASLFFTISQRLLKLMSIESMMLPNHLILCCPAHLPDTRQLSCATPACYSAWYSAPEPRDTCLLICLILTAGTARHLPAHLSDTRDIDLLCVWLVWIWLRKQDLLFRPATPKTWLWVEVTPWIYYLCYPEWPQQVRVTSSRRLLTKLNLWSLHEKVLREPQEG